MGLIFPADVKVDENRNVWVLSDRMHAFLITGLDFSQVNFRIYTAPLQRLIGGTVCDLSTQISSRFGLNSILSSSKASSTSNIFGNTFGLSQGLGAFKTANSATPSQAIQSLNSQPLNAHALRVPLQPIAQISQLSSINPISQLTQLTPIAKISQVQAHQPLLAYDVREQINQQSPSFPSKSLTQSIYPTKSSPPGPYYKASTTFGAPVSQSNSDFSNTIQSLTKNPNWWTSQLW